jgi:hypothetical protein
MIFTRQTLIDMLKSISGQTGPPPPPPVLVVQWLLDEGAGTVAADNVGALDGALLNGVANTPPANGTSDGPIWSGATLTFDGVNDQVLAADTGLPIGNDPVSIFFRLSTSAVDGLRHLVFRYGDDFGATGVGMEVWTDGTIGFGLPFTGLLNGSTPVNDGVEHDCLLVWDGSQVLIYVDGNAETLTLNGASWSALATVLREAVLAAPSSSGAAGGQHALAGALRDVRVYSGALTPAEL